MTGGTTNATEIRIQRKNTLAFIKADPISLVLSRSDRIPNGKGGFTIGPPAPLPPQEVRLIPGDYKLRERETEAGTLVQPTHVLLGMHDANFRRFDRFTYDGSEYVLLWVYENPVYELKAEVLTLRRVP